MDLTDERGFLCGKILADLGADVIKVERDRLFIEADQYTMSHFFTLHLPAAKRYAVWQPWIKGYSGELRVGQRQVGPVYNYVWIDQDVKEAMGY